MTDSVEEVSDDAVAALEMARDLIREAKGAEGPSGGFVTDHLDAAENWLDKVETALSRRSIANTAGETVKLLEVCDPADDEAIEWVTRNLHAIRRDNGSMEYTLVAVVRAFQAGKAPALTSPQAGAGEPVAVTPTQRLAWNNIGEARASTGTLYGVHKLSSNVWAVSVNGTTITGWWLTESAAKAAAEKLLASSLLLSIDPVTKAPAPQHNDVRVTEAMVEAAQAAYRDAGVKRNWQHSWPDEAAMREILSAALKKAGA